MKEGMRKDEEWSSGRRGRQAGQEEIGRGWKRKEEEGDGEEA